MANYVRVDKVDRIGYLTLDRPDQRNPLSAAMMLAVTESLRALSSTPDIAVIVMKASGPAFSAGHNLHEMVGRTLDEEREIFRICTEMMQTIQQIPQPVIAAVQGTAVAAGCQLVATCDLAVASTTAVFGTPGVKIGLFCSTPMVAVSRAIGRKRALQMLLTGSVIDAATAADWGLINEVVAPDELDARVRALAESIAAASSLTLAVGKQAFYRQIDLPQAAAYEEMQEVMAINAVTCDAQEGMSAFISKRKPVWQGS
ncbi:enoyl-CoA hydratase [Smaragdicoccus niigatensis]|uniref:enoyl-CoA hydratase n=1 Tax=Smaragdicoccus niigatensis TaxID=359359 RepID=UPI00035EB093|nr:enoyl-CoA hydratase [Smaragdicoccus niigatensis]